MFGALTLDNRPSVSPGMDSGRPSLTVKHRLRGTDSGVAEHTIGMCGIEEMLLILWMTVNFHSLSRTFSMSWSSASAKWLQNWAHEIY